MSTGESHPVKAPDAVLVKRRWLRKRDASWAIECNEILMEHGQVDGTIVYPTRDAARWRARKLIDLLTRLELHERWHLREHVGRESGGWVWSVEYIRRQSA